ncbi:MAG: tRNA dihydrouridine synthase DusB [Alphaproteobacteria bacterium]|nr:tRNA dihydrouridine synthase DusB [Alphaproteobacteria bacterium]
MIAPDKIFAAPLAGITDKPFRRILRRCAPGAMLMTEMISCHSLVAAAKNCKRNFDTYGDEGLLGAQIFGADPRLMGEAARILQDQGATWIDINMGCPVPKVATKAGAGAFLMRDHALAGRIITEVVGAVKIPVSIKTRLGWDDKHLNSINLVRIAADAGAQFATVHGRTRAQGYAGRADWQKIADIKKQMGNFPIVFNGDIKTSADVAAVEKLAADGAMIGRALLGNPWLLGELCRGGSLVCHSGEGRNAPGASRCAPIHYELIMEHFDLVMQYYGERTGVPLFRKHAAWYSNGMKDAAVFRTRVNQIQTAAEMRKAIHKFFDRAD